MIFTKRLSFGGEMGVAATLALKGLGPQDPTKKLAHRVELLGQPLSQKKVFENLGPEPRPLKGHLFRSGHLIFQGGWILIIKRNALSWI